MQFLASFPLANAMMTLNTSISYSNYSLLSSSESLSSSYLQESHALFSDLLYPCFFPLYCYFPVFSFIFTFKLSYVCPRSSNLL